MTEMGGLRKPLAACSTGGGLEMISIAEVVLLLIAIAAFASKGWIEDRYGADAAVMTRLASTVCAVSVVVLTVVASETRFTSFQEHSLRLVGGLLRTEREGILRKAFLDPVADNLASHQRGLLIEATTILIAGFVLGRLPTKRTT